MRSEKIQCFQRIEAGLLVVLLSILLVGCGDGSDGGILSSVFGKTVSEKSQDLIKEYACDTTVAQNSAQRSPFFTRGYAYYTNSMTWSPLNPPTSDTFHETLAVTIKGTAYYLNVLYVIPKAKANGIVFNLHGLSSALGSMSIDSLRSPDETEYVKRGYAVVYVARRGAYGSTGPLIGSDQGYTSADYTNQIVSIADYQVSVTRYQSDSMLAALEKISVDPRFAAFKSRILLVGASGGTFTALYTAALAPMFKAATIRGVIRMTGSNSQDYLNDPYELTGERYGDSFYAAMTGARTLWLAGANDAIANPGQLACVYGFYAKKSVQTDQFYIVPGLDHGGWNDLWSPALYPTYSLFLRNIGFPEF